MTCILIGSKKMGGYKMHDMHIHVREGIWDINILESYVLKSIELGINEVLLLEHGRRISTKHHSYLNDYNTVLTFINNIEILRKKYQEVKILFGIEIDYSYDPDFTKETIKFLSEAKFDVVIGSIHSIKISEFKDYLNYIIKMITNYPINIVGHIKLLDNWREFETYLVDIIKICSRRGLTIEVNTSSRSLWTDEQLEFMISNIKKYNGNFTLGSDAHVIQEIGGKINETSMKIERIL